jgi:molecular chaperone HscB
MDADVLKNHYRRLQKVVHPDGWSQSDDKERLFAENQSSFLNKAYTALNHPLRRAQYLLELCGSPITESDGLLVGWQPSSSSTAESSADPDLLSEILDLRETVENAQRAQDLDPVQTDVQARIEKEEQELHALFDVQLDTASTLTDRSIVLSKAKEATVRLKYWYGILDACRDRSL